MIPEIDKEPAIHDRVLVEAQIGERLVGLRAVVVNVQPGALWLGLVRPDALLERIERNEPVRLTIRRESAAVVGDSAFVGHLGSGRSRLFSVSRPLNARVVQRRAYLRVDMDRVVGIRVLSQAGSGRAGRTGAGATRNICGGGILFSTDLELEPHDDVELTLTLGENDIATAEAEVVRIQPADETAADPPRPALPARWLAAVRFNTISEIDQDRIVRQVFSEMRRRQDGHSAS